MSGFKLDGWMKTKELHNVGQIDAIQYMVRWLDQYKSIILI